MSLMIYNYQKYYKINDLLYQIFDFEVNNVVKRMG